jgi:dolichyl-phosphate-mannose--protein O-mannosyl transferase
MIKSLDIQKYRLFYTIIGVLSFLILIFITAIKRVPPFWDELYYLNNVILLQEYGLTKEFLIIYKGPAGPTFAIIHYLANPLTHLSAPWVRLISVLLLGATLVLIFLCFKKLGQSKINSIALAFSTMAIPTIYTISGMALTEIPAIFFLTIAIYFIITHFISNTNNYFLAILTGLSLSFAILGRQPLMMIIMAIPILFINPQNFLRLNFKNNNFLKFIFVTLLISIIIPIIVFWVWGNIQPKSEAYTGVGLVPNHFILALGYSCIFTLLVNPKFFK